jgi:hypothetical protein
VVFTVVIAVESYISVVVQSEKLTLLKGLRVFIGVEELKIPASDKPSETFYTLHVGGIDNGV